MKSSIRSSRRTRCCATEGRSIRNVVFMGMGEPLLNEAEVYQALDVLLSPQCFDLSPAHVLVSTVGIPDAMVRCAERFPRVGMALSLHSAQASRSARASFPWPDAIRSTVLRTGDRTSDMRSNVSP